MARLQSAGGLSPGKDENEASTPFGALWGVFALVNRSYFHQGYLAAKAEETR